MTPGQTKRRATVQASGTTKKVRSQTDPAPPSPPHNAPEIPKDASPRTAVNNLHFLPGNGRRDFGRPWLLYDYVDPTPKFHWMRGKRTREPHASEAEDEDDLTDTPPEGGIESVVVHRYR